MCNIGALGGKSESVAMVFVAWESVMAKIPHTPKEGFHEPVPILEERREADALDQVPGATMGNQSYLALIHLAPFFPPDATTFPLAEESAYEAVAL